MKRPKEGDVVYCDPPYTHSQSIIYGAQEFNIDTLWKMIAECKERGAKVMLSINGMRDSKKKDKHFCLKTSEGLLCFSHKNILYAECFRRMVLLHTVDGKSVKSVCIRNSFEGELSELLAADNFLQTHKSYIVNMDYIDSFRQGEVRLISGDVIRISKNRQSQVKKCVLKYMADKNR